MDGNVYGFVVLLVLSVVTGLVVLFLVRKSLRALLDDVAKLPPCTTFYTRVLAIALVFIGLGQALGTEFALEKNAAFMEYVWKVADGLSSVFGTVCLFMTAYLIVITILVSVLRRRSE